MVFARENSDGLTSLVKGLNKATDNKSLNSFVCFLSDDEGLQEAVKEIVKHKPGDKIKVGIKRGDKDMTIEVTVGKRSEIFPPKDKD